MRQLMIVLIFLSCLTGCKEENTDGIFVSMNVFLSLQNDSGADLLNPTTENSISADDISVYYLIDGDEVLFNEPQLDYPGGFAIEFDQSTGIYILDLFTSDHINNESIATTIVKMEGMDSIRLDCEVKKYSNGSMQAVKVYYKNDLVWDNDRDKSSRYLEIVL